MTTFFRIAFYQSNLSTPASLSFTTATFPSPPGIYRMNWDVQTVYYTNMYVLHALTFVSFLSGPIKCGLDHVISVMESVPEQ
jgi:hypothetical protein